MRLKTAGILVLILLLLSSPVIIYRASSDVVEVTINDKERVVDGDDSKYLVFTDSEVFQNVDSWIYLKFNSSDYYNDIQVGGSYELQVAGWRIPFLSRYRNIVDYRELN